MWPVLSGEEVPRRMRMADLKSGWAVVGNDGRRLGTVRAAGQDYVRTSRGAFAEDVYVPASAIANVEDEVVYLNLTKREAEEMGWEQAPRDQDALDATPEDDLHRHI
jgi:hypothetical protein